jgi:hypothetical protein
METWKVFQNYLVSDYGRVMNRHTGRILKANDDNRGYLKVALSYKGKSVTWKIHKLVMYVFVGKRPIDHITNEPLQIDHIDRCKYNNHLSNLRYCTRKENCRNTKTYHADIQEENPKIRKQLIARKKRQNKNSVCYSIYE